MEGNRGRKGKQGEGKATGFHASTFPPFPTLQGLINSMVTVNSTVPLVKNPGSIMIDLLIIHDDQTIILLATDPPLLPDHSFVVADCDHAPPSTTTIMLPFSPQLTQSWRRRLCGRPPELWVTCGTVTDVESGIDSYNMALCSSSSSSWS